MIVLCAHGVEYYTYIPTFTIPYEEEKEEEEERAVTT